MSFVLNDHGFHRPVFGPEPNHRAGDAEFLDPDPACLIQIRPLLKADYGEWGVGREGNTILLARWPNGGARYVCYVRMPPHRRRNSRAGVMEAIKRISRYDASVASELRKIAATSKWPSRTAEASVFSAGSAGP